MSFKGIKFIECRRKSVMQSLICGALLGCLYLVVWHFVGSAQICRFNRRSDHLGCERWSLLVHKGLPSGLSPLLFWLPRLLWPESGLRPRGPVLWLAPQIYLGAYMECIVGYD